MAASSCSLDSDSWSLISSSDIYIENNSSNQNDSKQTTTTLSSPSQAAPPPSHSDGGALNDDYSDDDEIKHHPRKESERYHRLDLVHEQQKKILESINAVASRQDELEKQIGQFQDLVLDQIEELRLATEKQRCVRRSNSQTVALLPYAYTQQPQYVYGYGYLQGPNYDYSYYWMEQSI